MVVSVDLLAPPRCARSSCLGSFSLIGVIAHELIFIFTKLVTEQKAMLWTIATIVAVLVVYRTLRGWVVFLIKGEHIWWASEIKKVGQELAAAGFSGASGTLQQAATHFQRLDSEWKEYAQQSHKFVVCRQQLHSIQTQIKAMNDAASPATQTEAAIGPAQSDNAGMLLTSAEQLCADATAAQIKLTALGLHDTLNHTRSFAAKQAAGRNTEDPAAGAAGEACPVPSKGLVQGRTIRADCAVITEEVLLILNQLEALEADSYQKAVQARSEHCDKAIQLLQKAVDARFVVAGAGADEAAKIRSIAAQTDGNLVWSTALSEARTNIQKLETQEALNAAKTPEGQGEEVPEAIAEAQTLVLQLEAQQQACVQLFQSMPIDKQAAALGAMTAKEKVELTATMAAEEQVAVLRALSVEVRAAALREMSIDDQEAALEIMSAAECAAAQQALTASEKLKALTEQVRLQWSADARLQRQQVTNAATEREWTQEAEEVDHVLDPEDVDHLKAAFRRIDSDGNGSLTREECVQAADDNKRIRQLLDLDSWGNKDRFEHHFSLIDKDDSNEIDLDEFLHLSSVLRAEARAKQQRQSQRPKSSLPCGYATPIAWNGRASFCPADVREELPQAYCSLLDRIQQVTEDRSRQLVCDVEALARLQVGKDRHLRRAFYPALQKVLKVCEPRLRLELKLNSQRPDFLLQLRAALPAATELQDCQTHNPCADDVNWFVHGSPVPNNLSGMTANTSPCRNAGCAKELCAWYQRDQHPSLIPRRLLCLLVDLTDNTVKWLQASPGAAADNLFRVVRSTAEQLDLLMNSPQVGNLLGNDLDLSALVAGWEQDASQPLKATASSAQQDQVSPLLLFRSHASIIAHAAHLCQVESTSSAIDFAEGAFWKLNDNLKASMIRIAAQLSLHLDPSIHDQLVSAIQLRVDAVDKKLSPLDFRHRDGCIGLAKQIKSVEVQLDEEGKVEEKHSLNADTNCMHFMEVATFAAWAEHMTYNEHPISRLLGISYLVQSVESVETVCQSADLSVFEERLQNQQLHLKEEVASLLQQVSQIHICPGEEELLEGCLTDESLHLFHNPSMLNDACDRVDSLICGLSTFKLAVEDAKGDSSAPGTPADQQLGNSSTEVATLVMLLENLDSIQLHLYLLRLMVDLHTHNAKYAQSFEMLQQVYRDFQPANATGNSSLGAAKNAPPHAELVLSDPETSKANVSDVKQVATELALQVELQKSSTAAHLTCPMLPLVDLLTQCSSFCGSFDLCNIDLHDSGCSKWASSASVSSTGWHTQLSCSSHQHDAVAGDLCPEVVSAEVARRLPQAASVCAELCANWLQWNADYPRLTCAAAVLYICKRFPAYCVCKAHSKDAKSPHLQNADPNVAALEKYIGLLAKCILDPLIEYGGEDLRLSQAFRGANASQHAEAVAGADLATELALTPEAQSAVLDRCQQTFDEALYKYSSTNSHVHGRCATPRWHRVQPLLSHTGFNSARAELAASAVAAQFPGEISIYPLTNAHRSDLCYEVHLRVKTSSNRHLDLAIPEDFPQSPPQLLLTTSTELLRRWAEFGLLVVESSSQYRSLWTNCRWDTLKAKLQQVSGKRKAASNSAVEESALVNIIAQLQLTTATEFTSADYQQVVTKCHQLASSQRFRQAVGRRSELLQDWAGKLLAGPKSELGCDDADFCMSSANWPLGYFVDSMLGLVDCEAAINLEKWNDEFNKWSDNCSTLCARQITPTRLLFVLVLDDADSQCNGSPQSIRQGADSLQERIRAVQRAQAAIKSANSNVAQNSALVEAQVVELKKQLDGLHCLLPRWCQQAITDGAINSPEMMYIEVVLLASGKRSMFREGHEEIELQGFNGSTEADLRLSASGNCNLIFPWSKGANGTNPTTCWFDKSELETIHKWSKDILSTGKTGALSSPSAQRHGSTPSSWIPSSTGVGMMALSRWLQEIKHGTASIDHPYISEQLKQQIESLEDKISNCDTNCYFDSYNALSSCLFKITELVTQGLGHDDYMVDLSKRWIRFYPQVLDSNLPSSDFFEQSDVDFEVGVWKRTRMTVRSFARSLWQSDIEWLKWYIRHVEGRKHGVAYFCGQGEDRAARQGEDLQYLCGSAQISEYLDGM